MAREVVIKFLSKELYGQNHFYPGSNNACVEFKGTSTLEQFIADKKSVFVRQNIFIGAMKQLERRKPFLLGANLSSPLFTPELRIQCLHNSGIMLQLPKKILARTVYPLCRLRMIWERLGGKDTFLGLLTKL